MDGLRRLPMHSPSTGSRPSRSAEKRGPPRSRDVPDQMLDPVARQLTAQLCNGGSSITTDRSSCLTATPAPAGQVVNWEAASATRGFLSAGTANGHSLLGGGQGGNPCTNLLLVANGDPMMQPGDPECLTEPLGGDAHSRATSVDGDTLIRNSNCQGGQSRGLCTSLSQKRGCNPFDVLPGLIPGIPVVEHLLWNGRGQQRLRRTSALDVQAPPGYEPLDFNILSGFKKSSVPQQEALTHDFPLTHRMGCSDILQDPCEQWPNGEYFRRRSSTLSPPTQPARAKGWGRKGRSVRGFTGSTTCSTESVASAPLHYSPDGLGHGITPQTEPPRDEGGGPERIPRESWSSQGYNQLDEMAASFVGLLYNSLFDRNHSVPPAHLPDIVAALYPPWCTRKQLLDPQLMGELAHGQPVFDEGRGHANVLRQLTVLRSCLSEFSLTVEYMQACVTATGRLSCALRGTMVPQRGQGGACEPGRDGASRGVMDFAATAKMGRFAHFLTLQPKPLSTKATDPLGENGGKTSPNSGPWFPLVHGSSFVVESEVLVFLTGSQEGVAHLAPQVISEHSFMSEADHNPGAMNGFSGIPGIMRSGGSRGGVGPLHGGIAQSHSTREALSCLSSMLQSAMSLGSDAAVSAPGGKRDQSNGDLPNGPDCVQAAVAKLATSLLADAGIANQSNGSATTIWPPFMRDSAQKQRRSRRKKKSKQSSSDRSQKETQLLPGGDLAAADTQLSSFQLHPCMQMQDVEQRLQEQREDLSNTCVHANGILSPPGFQGIPQDAFDRTVFVSWIPRAARAQAVSEKAAAEQKLKTVLAGELGISGIERVLLFPPRGSHCCIAFHSTVASTAFLMEYAGGTFTPNTEKFKRRICCSFNVEFDRGIQRVFIRIEAVRIMPLPVGVAESEHTV